MDSTLIDLTVVAIPDPEKPLRCDDVLVVVGTQNDLERFRTAGPASPALHATR